MATSTETVRELTEQEVLNNVVPRWAQALNWFYNHTFAYLDRFIDYVAGAPTRAMVADFEAAEQAKAQQAQS